MKTFETRSSEVITHDNSWLGRSQHPNVSVVTEGLIESLGTGNEGRGAPQKMPQMVMSVEALRKRDARQKLSRLEVEKQ